MSNPSTMNPPTEWHGTEEELVEFKAVLNRNCTCQVDECGQIADLCPVHKALLHDQRWLNGMVYARRLRKWYTRAERTYGKPWQEV
jgi:hypothetical protein